MDGIENDLVASSHGLNWIWLDEHGHVQIEPEALIAYLAEGAEPYIVRRDELLAALDRIPAVIEDEEWNKKATDYVGMITKLLKAIEAEREARKSPFLAASRAVDGYFGALVDKLGTPKGRDRAGQAREIVETRMTLYQRAKADAERRAREEAAKIEREEAERRRREAEQAERVAQTEKDLQAAIDRDTAARQAEADASRIEKAAAAPLADLSRTRSDLGATSSLTRFWTFRALDRAALDLEALRSHLPHDALEAAVRSFIKAGGRKLDGVEIFEDSRTRVRA